MQPLEVHAVRETSVCSWKYTVVKQLRFGAFRGLKVTALRWYSRMPRSCQWECDNFSDIDTCYLSLSCCMVLTARNWKIRTQGNEKLQSSRVRMEFQSQHMLMVVRLNKTFASNRKKVPLSIQISYYTFTSPQKSTDKNSYVLVVRLPGFEMKLAITQWSTWICRWQTGMIGSWYLLMFGGTYLTGMCLFANGETETVAFTA